MDTPADRRWDAFRVYLILSAGSALFFSLIATVNLVFQVERVGLNPLQLVLVGTALELSAFVFEVPTGVVADVYSRRLSIIIGFALMGGGFALGAIPSFTAILLAQVVWGIGYTFTSGATQAWIADEIGEEHAGQAFLRGAQAEQLGAVAGTLLAIALAQYTLQLPIVVGGTLFVVLAVFLSIAMPERGFHALSRAEREAWSAMTGTFIEGVRLTRRRPILLTILGIAVFSGLFSEGFDRLWIAHLLRNFTLPRAGGFGPVVWIGGVRLGLQLLGAGALRLVASRMDTNSHHAVTRALIAFETALIASVLIFALAGGFWLALVAVLAAGIARDLLYPLKTAWVNQNLDSRVRATVISMNGQADALGQIAGGPAIGAVGAAVSLRAALALAGLALSPALLLYARAYGQGRPLLTLAAAASSTEQRIPQGDSAAEDVAG